MHPPPRLHLVNPGSWENMWVNTQENCRRKCEYQRLEGNIQCTDKDIHSSPQLGRNSDFLKIILKFWLSLYIAIFSSLLFNYFLFYSLHFSYCLCTSHSTTGLFCLLHSLLSNFLFFFLTVASFFTTIERCLYTLVFCLPVDLIPHFSSPFLFHYVFPQPP